MHFINTIILSIVLIATMVFGSPVGINNGTAAVPKINEKYQGLMTCGQDAKDLCKGLTDKEAYNACWSAEFLKCRNGVEQAASTTTTVSTTAVFSKVRMTSAVMSTKALASSSSTTTTTTAPDTKTAIAINIINARSTHDLVTPSTTTKAASSTSKASTTGYNQCMNEKLEECRPKNKSNPYPDPECWITALNQCKSTSTAATTKTSPTTQAPKTTLTTKASTTALTSKTSKSAKTSRTTQAPKTTKASTTAQTSKTTKAATTLRTTQAAKVVIVDGTSVAPIVITLTKSG